MQMVDSMDPPKHKRESTFLKESSKETAHAAKTRIDETGYPPMPKEAYQRA